VALICRRARRPSRSPEISLDAERWTHILDGHPELRDRRGEVLRAVESPSEVLAGGCRTKSGSFDRVKYESDADVLYLHVGDPSTAVDFDETSEGHALRFDAEGMLVGITLVRPKHLLDGNGGLRITLPVPSDVPAGELTPALSA
jgi:uncharacterized protein YuzE